MPITNYNTTRLALKVVRQQFEVLRYWIIAILTGTFRNISDGLWCLIKIDPLLVDKYLHGH
jgi:hypothetical protein